MNEEVNTLREQTQNMQQLENKMEVYSEKLKELPELKAKYADIMKQNIHLTEMQGSLQLEKEENQNLMESVRLLSDQVQYYKDDVADKELTIARMTQQHQEALKQKEKEIKKIKEQRALEGEASELSQVD